MIEKIHQKLSDSKVARWSVLALAKLDEYGIWLVHQRLRLVQRISFHVDYWWYRSG